MSEFCFSRAQIAEKCLHLDSKLLGDLFQQPLEAVQVDGLSLSTCREEEMDVALDKPPRGSEQNKRPTESRELVDRHQASGSSVPKIREIVLKFGPHCPWVVGENGHNLGVGDALALCYPAQDRSKLKRADGVASTLIQSSYQRRLYDRLSIHHRFHQSLDRFGGDHLAIKDFNPLQERHHRIGCHLRVVLRVVQIANPPLLKLADPFMTMQNSLWRRRA
mmetsp:Transcript_5193/g.8404  ORF Transcript_5193/g.8404 Transcript_5193/m.8404 type:complete len:220 (+) Transcript_5193:118-777(+)